MEAQMQSKIDDVIFSLSTFCFSEGVTSGAEVVADTRGKADSEKLVSEKQDFAEVDCQEDGTGNDNSEDEDYTVLPEDLRDFIVFDRNQTGRTFYTGCPDYRTKVMKDMRNLPPDPLSDEEFAALQKKVCSERSSALQDLVENTQRLCCLPDDFHEYIAEDIESDDDFDDFQQELIEIHSVNLEKNAQTPTGFCMDGDGEGVSASERWNPERSSSLDDAPSDQETLIDFQPGLNSTAITVNCCSPNKRDQPPPPTDNLTPVQRRLVSLNLLAADPPAAAQVSQNSTKINLFIKEKRKSQLDELKNLVKDIHS